LLTGLAGLLLSLLLIARGQVGGDQLKLLARGWALVVQGTWIVSGNPTSLGGYSPGGVTSLFVAAPLLLWRDARAPAVFILLTQLAAYFLIDRVIRDACSPRQRTLLAVYYWLNPWRLFFSGFLWNPNWLFLAGAIHLYTAYRQRERYSPWLSFAQAAAIAIGLQLHLSAVVLACFSAVLVIRRRQRIHWGGAMAGAVAGSATLVPWMFAAAQNPAFLPNGDGFLGRGLLYLFPMARGLGYWLRYGSLLITERAITFDFTADFGVAIDRRLAEPAYWMVMGIGAATLVFAFACNVRVWRDATAPSEPRGWLASYVRLALVAFLLMLAIAPTTPMAWQGLIIFHAAVLPLVLFPFGKLAPAFAAGSLVIAILIGFGAPQYRCGGREGLRFPIQNDHPMLHDLRIQQRCPWPVDPVIGWPISHAFMER
jgi:hypothetical protein